MVRRAWRGAVLKDRRTESPSARTLVLDVDGWPGHLPGQHVDVRLTADDGYQAARSYSLAAPAEGDTLQITVQRTAGGEVSPFLTDDLAPGDEIEVRGPLGGWFVWRAESPGPVLLVGGGSGVVPLMAMVRARPAGHPAPFRLVYSVRTPADRIYPGELEHRAAQEPGLQVSYVYTRQSPEGDDRPPGRLGAADLAVPGWEASATPTCYVCGPTPFVETVAALLVEAGHQPDRIRTERFGGTA
jgi:ferredoxin-NADP reductase